MLILKTSALENLYGIGIHFINTVLTGYNYFMNMHVHNLKVTFDED